MSFDHFDPAFPDGSPREDFAPDTPRSARSSRAKSIVRVDAPHGPRAPRFLSLEPRPPRE